MKARFRGWVLRRRAGKAGPAASAGQRPTDGAALPVKGNESISRRAVATPKKSMVRPTEAFFCPIALDGGRPGCSRRRDYRADVGAVAVETVGQWLMTAGNVRRIAGSNC